MNPIPGCDGYCATAQGEIMSVRSGVPRIVKQRLCNGYLVVTLRTRPRPAHRTKQAVHRLVAQAFRGLKPFDGAEVRHLNGVSIDNRIENLAWGTRAENAQDAVRHGTAVGLRKGDEHCRTKLRFVDVQTIRSSSDTAAALASRYGVTPLWIDRIKDGRARVAA